MLKGERPKGTDGLGAERESDKDGFWEKGGEEDRDPAVVPRDGPGKIGEN